ncbi:TauD/TfdA family dioxygenase [Aquimarina rubra]|uniref:TauD/TfdA family dioxygenase n=1 Tax=Aquimarina rubra TaxID=1920033 RepID=A0ABW5LME0_9FLAO
MKDWLIKYDFEEKIDPKEIISKLNYGTHIVQIKNFPKKDLAYENFITKLGNPIIERRNNQGRSVFDVKISLQNNLFKSLANSNLRFPLHTDCSDFEKIPNCIGMLCIKPASKEQGVNSFAFLDNILDKLSDRDRLYLINKKWLFRNQNRSILNKDKHHYRICYDRVMIESFSKTDHQELEKLDQLDRIFESCKFNLKMKEGDLIIFRNDIILHGREGFDKNSDRLIKRIRFNVLK